MSRFSQCIIKSLICKRVKFPKTNFWKVLKLIQPEIWTSLVKLKMQNLTFQHLTESKNLIIRNFDK